MYDVHITLNGSITQFIIAIDLPLPAYIDKSIHFNCIDAKISFGAERRIIEGVALFRLSESEVFVEEYCSTISVKCKLAVTNCPGQ